MATLRAIEASGQSVQDGVVETKAQDAAASTEGGLARHAGHVGFVFGWSERRSRKQDSQSQAAPSVGPPCSSQRFAADSSTFEATSS